MDYFGCYTKERLFDAVRFAYNLSMLGEEKEFVKNIKDAIKTIVPNINFRVNKKGVEFRDGNNRLFMEYKKLTNEQWDIIAQLNPNEWEITSEEIQKWLEKHKYAEKL